MFGELLALNRSLPSPPQPGSSAPKFPRYLLPSFSFSLRRRSCSSHPHISYRDDTLTPSSSTGSGPSNFPSESYTVQARDRLARVSPSLIRCLSCRSDLAFHSQIVSKGFHGRHGKALLVAPPSREDAHEKTPNTSPAGLNNIRLGPTEKRQLATGPHEVADIFCAICETKLGWKYIKADEPSQKYKVGKYILEVFRVTVEQGLEFEPVEHLRAGNGKNTITGDKGGECVGAVVFDSDDEDECEDLFNGVWNAEDVAARRRMDVKLGRGHEQTYISHRLLRSRPSG